MPEVARKIAWGPVKTKNLEDHMKGKGGNSIQIVKYVHALDFVKTAMYTKFVTIRCRNIF